VAYLCIGKVKGYHPRPELETAGWRSRLPLESLVHFEQWGEQSAEPALLDQLRDSARAARDGSIFG
jgi:5,6-dimethylbenzimidazole synthase